MTPNFITIVVILLQTTILPNKTNAFTPRHTLTSRPLLQTNHGSIIASVLAISTCNDEGQEDNGNVKRNAAVAAVVPRPRHCHHVNPSRKQILINIARYTSVAVVATLTTTATHSTSALAANLPSSTGADLSRTGTVDTLMPIVSMKLCLDKARSLLVNSATPANSSSSSISSNGDQRLAALRATIAPSIIPRDETSFKRLFDAYSTPVSYKQKFLDQNAFLVYYTRGFDGPGRPNIEYGGGGGGDNDGDAKQTLQYGARNDAWVAMDEFLVELDFVGREPVVGDDAFEDLIGYVEKVLRALDSYLSVAPEKDVDEALQRLGR